MFAIIYMYSFNGHHELKKKNKEIIEDVEDAHELNLFHSISLANQKVVILENRQEGRNKNVLSESKLSLKLVDAITNCKSNKII